MFSPLSFLRMKMTIITNTLPTLQSTCNACKVIESYLRAIPFWDPEGGGMESFADPPLHIFIFSPAPFTFFRGLPLHILIFCGPLPHNFFSIPPPSGISNGIALRKVHDNFPVVNHYDISKEYVSIGYSHKNSTTLILLLEENCWAQHF